ncbi:hypothetical protein [Arthrobacter sp. NicSoilC5]|uniref:hypothetical protein n=1 Tax=Arthrobacter sp. NicSoilC5 TaxID=2831000 RepID=UPI001CC44D53|nr:hypothetical protein [Arthrobacter sp. NicSoilC5]BCW78295.1 hypothetical protein NicSoilC5_03140 [Arthrobacter sp. NicSoilC5]
MEWTDIGELKRGIVYFVSNNSPLPVYNVLLYAGPVDSRRKEVRAVLAPTEEASFKMSTSDFMPFVKFVDSAGVAWKRDGSGKLTELKSGDSFPWTMD